VFPNLAEFSHKLSRTGLNPCHRYASRVIKLDDYSK
jgi:hypothetical protein